MKILVLARLYSHLIPSVTAGAWRPTGMPAFCNLIEELDRREADVHVLFQARDDCPGLTPGRAFRLSGLEHIAFRAVRYNRYRSRRLSDYVNAIRHAGAVWRLLRRSDYDLVYCDRAHIIAGGLLARLGKRVFLRLHGVARLPEAMRILEGRRRPSLLRWALAAPFAHVLCTKDGSPGTAFLDRYLRESVPREVRLNGVQPLRRHAARRVDLRNAYSIPEAVRILLVTGRLDRDKAPGTIVEALAQLKASAKRFFAVFVGEGTQRQELETQVKQRGLAENVLFTGRVPHEHIPAYLAQADIYISLNQYGNLSNAVLEAMRAGRCIVTLDTCSASERDEQAREPELRDALVLIDRQGLPGTLTRALNELLEAPDVVNAKAEKMQRYADAALPAWEARIRYEADLLDRVVRRAQGCPAPLP